jgi:hypothetical protein
MRRVNSMIASRTFELRAASMRNPPLHLHPPMSPRRTRTMQLCARLVSRVTWIVKTSSFLPACAMAGLLAACATRPETPQSASRPQRAPLLAAPSGGAVFARSGSPADLRDSPALSPTAVLPRLPETSPRNLPSTGVALPPSAASPGGTRPLVGVVPSDSSWP